MKRLIFLIAALLVVTLYGGARAENFNVSSISDLRDALGDALTSDEEDTINIAAGTYAVSDPLYFWGPGPLTDPMQDKYNHPLTINGAGKDVTILDGGGAGSILNINTLSLQQDNSLTINISNLTFRNSGNSSLVASTTAAPITVSNSAFTGNTTRGAELLSGSGIINLFNNTFSDTVGGSTGAGAFIYTDSAIFANNNVFTGNTAHSSDGGGLAVFAAGGSASITNNTFGDNTASGTYGGGLLVFTTSGATATVSGNQFTNNLSVDKGGGLSVQTSMETGLVTVNGNTFTGNSGGEGGGLHVVTGDNAVFVTNNTFTGNKGSSGGGLFASALSPSASVTLNGNTFSGNSAAWGGGASVGSYQGSVDLSGETFSGNTGRIEGGALFVAPVFGGNSFASVSDTLFTGNWADKGGAVFVESTGLGAVSFTLQNSIVTDNAAGVSGGGLAAASDGAGSLTQVTLKNDTFTINRALRGGGLWASSSDSGTTAVVSSNEIIWGNRAVKSGADIFIIGKGNTIVSPSFSTIGKVTNSKSYPGLYFDDGTNIAGTPVLVNPYLGDCHLNSDSPAIDAGTATGAPSSDFEGDARPQGAGYDMGADEYTASFYPDVTLLSFIGGEGIPSGRRCDITWGAPPEALKFTLKYSLNNGKRWKNIARDVTGRHFSWKVPRLLKNKPKCLVKVSGYNASGGVAGTDRSGTPFTIEVLRLNSPNGGEVLASGNSCIIRWATNGTKKPVRKVKLFYSTRRPPVWKKIATLGRTAESHEWSVPSVVTARKKCKVKAVLKDKFGKTVGVDTSDAFFTIRP